MKDEIIQSLWQVKDELGRRAKHNVRTLCRQLRAKQADSQLRIVDRSGTRPTTGTRKAR
jgi:hypothetical protein